MPVLRAQVVLPHNDGIPRHGWSNQFFFDTLPGADVDVAAANIEGMLATVYGSENAPSTTPIGELLSEAINRPACHVRIYNMSDPEPRAPIRIGTDLGIPAAQTPNDLPSEVRLCGSFRASIASGLHMARHRGRVYFGPFNQAADAEMDGVSRPSDETIISINSALNALRALSADVVNGAVWGVYSLGARDNSVNGNNKPWDAGYVHPRNRPLLPPVFTQVDFNWVDDAWDTIRKGGEAPTIRATGGQP